MKIVKIKEQKNGSILCDVGLSKEESDLIKKYYNKKRLTNKLLQKFVIEGLENYLDKEETK